MTNLPLKGMTNTFYASFYVNHWIHEFMKTNIEENFKKFVELLKKLHINIPFTEALSYMPKYAKFLEEVLSNKKNLDNTRTMAFTEECNTPIHNKLAPK